MSPSVGRSSMVSIKVKKLIYTCNTWTTWYCIFWSNCAMTNLLSTHSFWHRIMIILYLPRVVHNTVSWFAYINLVFSHRNRLDTVGPEFDNYKRCPMYVTKHSNWQEAQFAAIESNRSWMNWFALNYGLSSQCYLQSLWWSDSTK